MMPLTVKINVALGKQIRQKIGRERVVKMRKDRSTSFLLVMQYFYAKLILLKPLGCRCGRKPENKTPKIKTLITKVANTQSRCLSTIMIIIHDLRKV